MPRLKLFVLLGIGFLQALALRAQTATPATISYNGVEFPCKKLTFDAAPGVVESEIKSGMQKKGHRDNGKKGWMLFNNVALEHGAQKVDVYLKVEPVSKKDETRTNVYVFTTEPGVVPSRRKDAKEADLDGAVVAAGGAAFVMGLEGDIASSELERRLELQSKKISYEEKELDKLKTNADKLRKDLEDNQKAMDTQQEKLTEMRKQLEALRKQAKKS